MKHNKLSPLAEQLFTQLSKISHFADPATSALTLSDDPSIPAIKRAAYAELYQYLSNN